MTDRKSRDSEHRAAVQDAFNLLKILVDHAGEKHHHQALALLRPSLYGLKKGRRAGPFKSERFVELMKTRKVISELDIFKEFRIDRNGVRRLLRDYRKRHPEAAENYIVDKISLDPGRGVYRFE